ncbi:hypothetical protein HDU78_011411, partial [Chytriomyces hyalinus]
GEAVMEKEAWDAWAEFGGLEEDGELPEVPCEMIGEVVATRRADAMAKRMREESEEASNKRMPPCAAEYPQPSTAKATPIPMARRPKLASYPKIHLPRTHPDPALSKTVPPAMPKTVPPVPKPPAKYQYKKSTKMASVDLDKRTVEILMSTKIELSAMDLIAFSPFFCKKVNDISRTHRTAVDEIIEANDPVPDASATVGFL